MCGVRRQLRAEDDAAEGRKVAKVDGQRRAQDDRDGVGQAGAGPPVDRHVEQRRGADSDALFSHDQQGQAVLLREDPRDGAGH